MHRIRTETLFLELVTGHDIVCYNVHIMCSCEAWSTWMAHWMQRLTLSVDMRRSKVWETSKALSFAKDRDDRWEMVRECETFIHFYTFVDSQNLAWSCLLWDCEAMAKRYLGDTLDIHGGGLGNQEDLADLADCLEPLPLRHLWLLQGRIWFSRIMKMKSHKVHISELSELSRMCWMDVGCVSDQIADVALRRSSQWPALCQNVDALCSCVGSQSACERLHPGAPRLCWDCSHLHIYFTGNPCACKCEQSWWQVW